MCCSCGCQDWEADHGDSRHITSVDLISAATAANIPMKKLAKNLDDACDAQMGKSLAIKAQVHTLDDVDEWDSTGVQTMVVKSEEEQRYTLTVAYPANKPDIARAQDGFIDFAGTQAVEKAAWSYLRKSPNVGLWHKDGTDGSGEVCESYIYRGPDWTIKASDGSEQLIKAGDWLMGIIWSEESWPLVKQGLIGGVSPQGRARRRLPDADSVKNLRS